MRRSLSVSAVVLLALTTPIALGQFAPGVPSTDDYVRLLKATKYVETYKEMAAVSARVFGARGLGSDKDYARLMAVVAKADLSDAESCLVGVYRSQDLTKQDLIMLLSIFESPLGIKLTQASQRKLISDLERGSVQPFPTDAFTEDEKREIMALRQNNAFRKYSLIGANPAVAKSMLSCILESRDVKSAGIPLGGK